MGKDREGKYHPAKGKPSGANKEEDRIPPDLPGRHPNRNTSKGEDFTSTNNASNKSVNETFSEGFSKTQPEEIHGILTKDMFNELASFQGTPSISIVLPTHKSGMEVNEQVDLIAFKNALQEVEKQLNERKTDQTLVKRMLEPGYGLLRDESFWRNLTQGLAVYIADNYFKYLRLPGPVSEHIRINSSFYVSPLVPFMVKKEYFYILDIAKKFPRFYKADAFGIEHLQIEEMPSGVDDVVHFEEKEDEKLFRTGGRGGTGGANFHGIGGGKPDEKEHIAIYLEEVDDTIWKTHLNRSTAPLLLAGQDFLIPIYKSVSDYSYIWPEALTGNHHQQNDNELYEEAMQVMQPYFDQSLNKSLEDYGNKSATDLTTSVIADVIPAAYYGQISQLFVKKGSQVWGTFNEQENKLNTVSEPEKGTEDLVDKAIIKTIQNGGDVFILDEEQMPAKSELAAILRYSQ
jgi:hypothetical protein